MSRMDQLITDKLNRKSRSIKRDEFYDFIEESLKQVGEINEAYKKLYEDSEESPAVLKSIEEKYEKIKNEYDNLFVSDEQGIVKSNQLQEQIQKIQEYHKELLEGSDEEGSIKADIKDSQDEITKFYNFLFDKEENSTETNEEKTKKCITEIEEFYNKLINSESGIKKDIEDKHAIINEKYLDLFGAEEGKKTKIESIEENIKNINNFNKDLDETIKTNLDNKQKYLEDVKKDIETKRKDVKSLLSNATLGALTQGYEESKHEYSKRKPIEWKDENGKVINNIFKVVAHNFGRHVPDF